MLLLTPLVLHSPKPVEDVIDGGILFSSVILNDSIKLYIYTHSRRVHTNTHANQVMLRESVLPLSLYGCVQRLIWLAGWLCWFSGNRICSVHTKYYTHKNETRNPNERENMYEWKVNNHRNIIEIWILASNSLDANVYIQFSTYVY